MEAGANGQEGWILGAGQALFVRKLFTLLILYAIHPTPAGIDPLLLPPGMDPAHVDLRTFYPYQPNEVKHRKRTTAAQLKVLEGIFKTDTKPSAALRTQLAAQLDMTPRGVQVWFQNRRAKEKLKMRPLTTGWALPITPAHLIVEPCELHPKLLWLRR
ncbi:Homeodomain-like protein [Flagelloscypha sp. PMI_526]|nr:Homeodomain-like protein [Flagelloscypha sp. PMI_526]